MLGGCLILLIVTVMNPKNHHLITAMGLVQFLIHAQHWLPIPPPHKFINPTKRDRCQWALFRDYFVHTLVCDESYSNKSTGSRDLEMFSRIYH
jgi:hypothetical protein